MNGGDEIADLARRYLGVPGESGLRIVDAEIAHASDEQRWDDVARWHRVRLRLIRLRNQQGAMAAVSLSPSPLRASAIGLPG